MRIDVKLTRYVPVLLAVGLAYGCASFPTMSVAPEPRNAKTPSVIPESRGGGLPRTVENVLQIPGAPNPVNRPTAAPPATPEQIAALVSNDPINATLPPQPLAQYLNTAFNEVLKVPYSLGPDIGARNTIITLNAPPTVTKRAYMGLLQNTLRNYGLTMSVTPNGVLITDDAAGPGGGFGANGRPQIIRSRSSGDTPQVGRVVQVFQLVALQASADLTALAQRIGGFPASSPTVQIDAAANALVVEGQARQVAAMVDILRTLDQPAYAGAQVVRLEPVYQSPIDFAANLQSALAAEGYIVSADPLGPKSIMILPLVSTNQTLVFAADRQTMARVQFWAREIDAPAAQGDQSSTFVYDVKNTSAAALGQMLINAGAQANQGRQGAGGGFPGGGPVQIQAPGVVAIGPNGQQRGPNGQVINNNAGRGNQQNQANRAGGNVNNANRGGANRAGANQAQNITGSAPTGGAITVDDAGNRILFTGTASQFAQLRSLLGRLDAPAREVLVEVTVAEVTLTDETRAGLEFFFNRSYGSSNLSGGTGTFPAPAAPAAGAPLAGGGAGLAGSGLGLNTSGATLNFANGDLRAAFNAFASNNKVNVLSRPHITAKSGSEAQIQVGDEVPIITSQRAAGTTTGGSTDTLQTVQYRQTGIILTITPVVYGDDRVDLTITQQVSDARANPNAAIGSPIIGSRTVSTTLTLADGRSAILGGLMEDSFSKGNTGVPFLKDIPILGQAFRSDVVSGRKTELVVLITPLIIRDADDMSHLAGQITNEINRAFEIGRGGSYTLTPYPLGLSAGIYPPKAVVVGGGVLQRPEPKPEPAPAAPTDALPAPAPAAAPAPKPRRRGR